MTNIGSTRGFSVSGAPEVATGNNARATAGARSLPSGARTPSGGVSFGQELDVASSSGSGSSGGTRAADQVEVPGQLTEIAPEEGGSTAQSEFLRLLVAQLQNQDPLTPQDGSEFIAQLAQFTAVEQAVETNRQLGELAMGQASAIQAGYASMVGKSVSAKVEAIELPGARGSLSVHLEGEAPKVEVRLIDESGKEVAMIEAHGGPGDIDLSIPEHDARGNEIPAGRYTVEITAKDKDGHDVAAYAVLQAVIDAMNVAGGTPVFSIGGNDVAPRDILEISKN